MIGSPKSVESGSPVIKNWLILLWWGLVLLAVGAATGCRQTPEEVRSGLKKQLREARVARLADLESYVKSGMFPHNHDVEGNRTPCLIDRHGRLCAVAYLVGSSEVPDFQYATFMNSNNRATWGYSVMGRLPDPGTVARLREAEQRQAAIGKSYREFASKLVGYASGNNHIRLIALADGPLMEWVLHSGLTLEECALIQPGYSYLSCNDCLPESEQSKGGAYNRPPGETETTHRIHAVTFGNATSESEEIAKADQTRIRKHLSAVIEKLRVDTEDSLDLAVSRLIQRVTPEPGSVRKP
ncbi:MAG: hypothetical protein V4819_03590 [Verrucomicrobiota bacterium]